jgi:hypothetical protein
LLQGDKPLLGVLRKGKLVFDVLTIDEDQLHQSAEIIHAKCMEVLNNE